MLSNNKFLGKCWYGGHPWIRLAMESERIVEKGIKFIFCLGTTYDISSMESVGSSKSFSLVGWIHPQIVFISKFFALSSGTSTNPYFPLRRAFFYFYVFTFMQRVKVFLSIPFLFFSFGWHHVVRKDLGTYVQLNMGGMSYYC